MSLCSATGNSGFPVTLQGEIKRAIIPDTSIQTTKFKTSLSIRSVPRTFNPENGYIDEMTGQDTFLFNTTPYLLQTAQIYNAKNSTVLLPTNAGAPVFTGQPAFGLALCFKKQQDNYAGESALIILIPIFSQATVTNAAEYHVDINAYFADMMSQTVSTTARSLGVFLNYEAFRCSYTTCIELRESAPLKFRCRAQYFPTSRPQGHRDIHRHTARQSCDPSRNIRPQPHRKGRATDNVPKDRSYA
jgi:hypothetical protein